MRNQFWKRMNRAPSYPCALCVLKTRGGRTPMAYLWRITDYAAIGVSKNPEQADCHAKSCRFAGLHVVLPHRWKGVAAQSSMDTALVVVSGETIQLPVQRLQQTHTADERSRLWPRRNRTQWSPERVAARTSTSANHLSADIEGRGGRYLFTVRGDTRMPSFNSNSLPIRSSPHEGFSLAIQRIRACNSRGMGPQEEI